MRLRCNINYTYMYFLLIAVVLQICFSLHLKSPNVCPKYVLISDQYSTTQQLVIECCADYYDDNGTCKECKSGLYGKNCLIPCLPNYYGVRCKQMCNCSSNKMCDPQFGCVCKPGWIGQNCRDQCPVDTYGLNCNKTCWCANNARCDQETGKCICPPGWIGNYCTKECPKGYFGQDCNQRCTCPSNADCSHVSGECECHEGFTGKGCSDIDMIKEENGEEAENLTESNKAVVLYIMMASAVVALICIVTVVVKAKQRVCRFVKKAHSSGNRNETNRSSAVQFNGSQIFTTIRSNRRRSVVTGIASQQTVTSNEHLPQPRYEWKVEGENVSNTYCEIDDVVTGSQSE